MTRRHERRLAGIGPLSFERVLEEAAALTTVEFIFEHKAQQYERTIQFNNFTLPGYAEFFRRLCSREGLNGFAELSRLRCGDQIIAAHLGYRAAGRYYYILPAFDAAWSGAGRVHTEHLLRASFDGGDAMFDLGEGAEEHKEVWATRVFPLYNYSRPRTLRGRIALSLNAKRHGSLEKRKLLATARDSARPAG